MTHISLQPTLFISKMQRPVAAAHLCWGVIQEVEIQRAGHAHTHARTHSHVHAQDPGCITKPDHWLAVSGNT